MPHSTGVQNQCKGNWLTTEKVKKCKVRLPVQTYVCFLYDSMIIWLCAYEAEKLLLGFRIIMPTLATCRQPGDRRSVLLLLEFISIFIAAEDVCYCCCGSCECCSYGGVYFYFFICNFLSFSLTLVSCCVCYYFAYILLWYFFFWCAVS